MTDVSQILLGIQQGEPSAADRLLPLVYDELRKLAAVRLAQENPGQTLQPTALVHEAYLRLVASGGRESPDAKHWEHRGHFFAAAAEAMRRILVDAARRKKAVRHGGGMRRVHLLEAEVPTAPTNNDDILLLDESLTRLDAARPQAAELVKLRFFSGITIEEAAPILGLSCRTTRRLWVFARAWLRRDMERAAGPEA